MKAPRGDPAGGRGVVLGAALGALLLFVVAGPHGSEGASAGGWLAFGLWAALISACERACGPLLLAEPLLAAGLGGLWIGEGPLGLTIGVATQLCWPGLLPLGGARLPASGLAALSALAVAASTGPLDPWLRLGLVLVSGWGAAGLGSLLERSLRRRNGRREKAWLDRGSAAWEGRLGGLVARGLLEAAVRGPLSVAPWVVLAAAARQFGGGAEQTLGVESILGPGLVSGGLFAVGGLLRTRLALWPGKVGAQRRDAPAATGEVSSAARRSPRAPVGRLLLLQAGFSRAGRQRVGFGWVLARRGPERPRAELVEALGAGAAANTQPLLAAALAGGLERVLAEAGESAPPRAPVRLLEVGGARLAAWGDGFIWGGLRPAVVLLWILGAPLGGVPWLVGLVGADLLVATAGRRWLFGWGWRAGWALVERRPWAMGSGAQRLLAGASGALGLGLLGWLVVRVGREGAGALAVSGIWFMLGLFLGRWGQARPLPWGGLCGGACLLGAVLVATLG